MNAGAEHSGGAPDEERILQIGYFAMLAERWPLNREIGQCLGRESAYFWALEREYFDIPHKLSFPVLQSDIAPAHRLRMQKIWEHVLDVRRRWEDSMRALRTKWHHVPAEVSNLTAGAQVTDTQLQVRKDLHMALSVIVTPSVMSEGDELPILELWQIEEKGLRGQFYSADKNYLVALRLYYEMLLEKPKHQDESDAEGQDWVLPPDHPERMNIVVRNRYLRVLDGGHQAISAAKSAHHQQEKARLRKVEVAPVLIHPRRVMMAYLFDVLPFIIEEKKLSHDLVLGCAVAAMHDLAEDTALGIRDIEQSLTAKADKYGDAIDPVIQSGFQMTRIDIKEKMLDLVGQSEREKFRQVMKVLSKDAPLTDQEKKRILARNIAGCDKTLKLLKLDSTAYESWGIDVAALPQQSKTFTRYPDTEIDEEKMDGFLARLSMFKRPAAIQLALMIKMEDRADNIATLRGRSVSSQRRTLRSMISRLIAWCMLEEIEDRDGRSRPLYQVIPFYNVLPRAIGVTLNEYRRFAAEFPDQTEDRDREYMIQLEQWQAEVERRELPDKVKKIMAEYEEASPPV